MKKNNKKQYKTQTDNAFETYRKPTPPHEKKWKKRNADNKTLEITTKTYTTQLKKTENKYNQPQYKYNENMKINKMELQTHTTKKQNKPFFFTCSFASLPFSSFLVPCFFISFLLHVPAFSLTFLFPF